MTLSLTQRALNASRKLAIEPNLVLKIEGLSDVFGAVEILKLIKIGDPGLTIGGGWVIGGTTAVENQETLISFDSGTTTSIQQQLRPDTGDVSSISSISISLIDKNGRASRLISPGIDLTDVLAAKAVVYFGFAGTAYPQDYVPIFRGIVQDIESGPGMVTLNIAHPDEKKRQKAFLKATSDLDGAITSGSTSPIALTSTAGFPQPVAGPDGSFDPAIKFYVRIDDEIIRYTGISGNTLTGITRAQLTTVANAHDDEASVESFIVLEDDAIPLALKLMLSGVNGFYVTALDITHVGLIGDASPLANTLFFSGVDLESEYGVTAGDYITTTGAANGANNVSAKVIDEVVVNDLGTYLVISGVSFVTEADTAATVSIRSKYDTLGDGFQMTPDQVDIARHEDIDSTFLAGTQVRFYIKDEIEGKEFIEKKLYAPLALYSLPRASRASLGYTIGPVPGEQVKIFSRANVLRPDQIKTRRSVTRHFYNTIVYKFNEDSIEDRFLVGVINTDADSKNRIKIGNKVQTFEASGLRSDLAGESIATTAANRLLLRYKFAAERIESLKVFFKDGFNVEPGDVHIIDFENLNVTNTQNGTRDKPAKFFEVVTKKLDIKSGTIDLSLVDTAFETDERFGLVSPSSVIGSGATTTVLPIVPSFGRTSQEHKKWEDFVGLPVRVHSEDYSFDEDRTLASINTAGALVLSAALSSPPTAGYVVDIPAYSTSTNKKINRLYKLLFAHFSPQVAVVSGASNTVFDVGAGDVGKFFVGSYVEVHNDDYTSVSPVAQVTDVTGTTITVDEDLGFTPTSSYLVDMIGFPDQENAYTII